jgi:hypothetical protein
LKTSLIFLLALSIFPGFAAADNFNCDSSPTEHLHVLIQDKIDPDQGTRTAAVLLVTDTQATTESPLELINSTKITQNGAFWITDASVYAKDTNPVRIGDFERSQLSEVQIYLPTFNFNKANKNGSLYDGHLFLYKIGDTDIFSQNIELDCVYTTNN